MAKCRSCAAVAFVVVAALLGFSEVAAFASSVAADQSSSGEVHGHEVHLHRRRSPLQQRTPPRRMERRDEEAALMRREALDHDAASDAIAAASALDLGAGGAGGAGGALDLGVEGSKPRSNGAAAAVAAAPASASAAPFAASLIDLGVTLHHRGEGGSHTDNAAASQPRDGLWGIDKPCPPGFAGPDYKVDGLCYYCLGSEARYTGSDIEKVCNDCPRGTYKPEPDIKPLIADYSEGSSTDKDECMKCDGASRRRRARHCTSCPPGHYQRGGEDDCAECLGRVVREGDTAVRCEECSSSEPFNASIKRKDDRCQPAPSSSILYELEKAAAGLVGLSIIFR